MDTERMDEQITIQPARSEDAVNILNVHYAAVHETAAPFYSKEVIQQWSPPLNNSRIERMQQVIENPDEWLVVAQKEERVIGFGSIVPNYNELRALYVHPTFARQGVGTRILAVLEQEAISLGLVYLQMDASINAEAFYIEHGFEVIEYGTHQFASGYKMACVKMRKTLNN